jgi:hypothetical protein
MTLTGHLYVEARWHKVAKSGEGRRWHDQAWAAQGKGKKLMGGARMSVSGEREGKSKKGATRQRKHILKNAPKALLLIGLSERR